MLHIAVINESTAIADADVQNMTPSTPNGTTI